mgnify:FL=1|tara:strand:+ start:2106 stop:2537 length:432 start_codon:yes stop_codon:yes gene_type:complete
MSVDVSRAFYTRLRTDTGGGTNPVRTSVGDRIFAMEAPASSALPLLVFSVTGASVTNFFGGNSQVQATVEVSLFGKTEAGPDALALIEAQVFALLHDQTVTGLPNFDRATIRSSSRGTPTIEGEYLRLDSTFIIDGTDNSASS